MNSARQIEQTIPSAEAAAADRRMTPLTALSLRSRTVTIGPMIPEDTAAIFLWLNDVESANLDTPYRPLDWMNYNAWITDFARNPAQVFFTIRRVVDPKVIGFLGFTKIHPVHRSAEIGVRIGYEADRGKGYGKDALALALKFAWDHLNLNRVQLNVHQNNHRAIRAYKAAGFQHEGTLRRAAFIDGAWLDVVLMGILRS